MKASSSTATLKEVPLRKRLRVLEKSRSLESLPSSSKMVSTDAKAESLDKERLKHKDGEYDNTHTPPMEYESPSDLSEDEYSSKANERSRAPQSSTAKPSRPAVNTADLPQSKKYQERSPMSPNSRAWYEFDLAVVVALVSPIGNWFTGTDHIKNIFLIILLIFYLHQIIEIPWTLYQNARPRTRPPHLGDTPESRYSQLAASELHKLELFFLFLTFFSPILGAMLLRYATDALLGPDAVSWFSTGLFILATGMRPWAHLVDRLMQRTTELHNFVHYPTHGLTEDKFEAMEKRVEQLENALEKMKAKMSHTAGDVYEYVDDAVDAVEHALRKQERKWDRYEGKVLEVEQTVVQLSAQSSRAGTPPGVQKAPFRRALAADIDTFKAYLRSMADHTLPTWLMAAAPSPKTLYVAATSPPLPGTGSAGLKRKSSGIRGPSSGSASSSPPSTPLETIFEEDPMYLGTQPTSSMWFMARPYYLTSALIYRIGYIATMPIRAVARMVFRNY